MVIPKPMDYDFKEYRIIDGILVKLHQIVVHEYTYTDVSYLSPEKFDDVKTWLTTLRAEWIIKNSFEVMYFDQYSRPDLGKTQVIVVATFEAKKLTEYYLRFGN